MREIIEIFITKLWENNQQDEIIMRPIKTKEIWIYTISKKELISILEQNDNDIFRYILYNKDLESHLDINIAGFSYLEDRISCCVDRENWMMFMSKEELILYILSI